ncbi:LysR-family transcriptional regulator [Cupriavidus basilensis]|uniref:LysR-family transcriptional regulator n=1 Tax=Cupriavidus basilensis TaxID=68895 RepID=A0A0C4YD58_9BURK|nr:LysR-family transcriptional regulator [Cupriavidus basilensis]
MVSPSLGQTLIPAAIARFRKRFPTVCVNLMTQTSTQLIQTLLTSKAELGVAMFSLDHPNIEQKSIYEDHLVVVLPQNHPLASRSTLHVRDLENVDLIGYSADTPFGNLIHQLFSGADIAVRLAVEVRLTHAACALVQAGVGITIADEVAVLGQVWPGVVIRPLLPDITMDVNVLHARFEPLSQLAQEFIHTLTELDFESLRRVA